MGLYGRAIRQVDMAELVGQAIWQGHMAKLKGRDTGRAIENGFSFKKTILKNLYVIGI